MWCHCMIFGSNTFSITCGCISRQSTDRMWCQTCMTTIMMHSVRRWSSRISTVRRLQWLHRAMHRWWARRVLWRWRPKIHSRLSDRIIAPEVSMRFAFENDWKLLNSMPIFSYPEDGIGFQATNQGHRIQDLWKILEYPSGRTCGEKNKKFHGTRFIVTKIKTKIIYNISNDHEPGIYFFFRRE